MTAAPCSGWKARLLRWGLLMLSGLLLFASFPPLGYSALVWVWPWPLLLVLWTQLPEGGGWRRGWFAFRSGYVMGLAFFVPNLYWIWHVHWAGWVALTLYLAQFPGWWAVFVSSLARRPSLANAALAAAFWPCLEWLRGYVLTGFGWNGVGVALQPWLWLMQPADIIGVNGLSILPVFVAAALVQSWLLRQWRGGIIAAVSALGLFSIYGFFRTSQASQSSQPPLRCLLLQTNVSQDERREIMAGESQWVQLSAEQQTNVQTRIQYLYDQLFDMTRGSSRLAQLDLVVWPESSLYYPLHSDYNQSFLDQVLATGPFSLACGADEINEGAYNCLVALRGDFKNSEIYRKHHLVIFGEFIPLRKQLPFLDAMFGDLIPADFDSGELLAPVQPKGQAFQIIPAVCFEDTVGRVVRQSVRDAPQVIVNVTNDGWFYESANPEQQWWNARLRCIELRRPMVRAANTGVTGALDAAGREIKRIPPFQEAILDVDVPLPDQAEITFYARFGDFFSATSGLSALIAGIWLRRHQERRSSASAVP